MAEDEPFEIRAVVHEGVSVEYSGRVPDERIMAFVLSDIVRHLERFAGYDRWRMAVGIRVALEAATDEQRGLIERDPATGAPLLRVVEGVSGVPDGE